MIRKKEELHAVLFVRAHDGMGCGFVSFRVCVCTVCFCVYEWLGVSIMRACEGINVYVGWLLYYVNYVCQLLLFSSLQAMWVYVLYFQMFVCDKIVLCVYI